MSFRKNDWLVVFVVVVALLIGFKGFLGSLLGTPTFTYSSFAYGAEPGEQLEGDFMVGKHDARVGPILIDDEVFVGMTSPGFVCDLNKWIKDHELSVPNDFSDVDCWEATVTLEGETFNMHPGETKVINEYLSIEYDVSGSVSWEDFECVYESGGVIYAQPLSCTASTLNQYFDRRWVGTINFFVDLSEGFSASVQDTKVNVLKDSEHEANIVMAQKVFKKIPGGVRVVHTQEGLYMTPDTLMQDAGLLKKGNTSVGVVIPTEKLGDVNSEFKPFMRIESPHLKWTGMSGILLQKSYGVKQLTFFEGLGVPSEEFRTTRDLPQTTEDFSNKTSRLSTGVWLVIILAIIIIVWVVSLKKARRT